MEQQLQLRKEPCVGLVLRLPLHLQEEVLFVEDDAFDWFSRFHPRPPPFQEALQSEHGPRQFWYRLLPWQWLLIRWEFFLLLPCQMKPKHNPLPAPVSGLISIPRLQFRQRIGNGPGQT